MPVGHMERLRSVPISMRKGKSNCSLDFFSPVEIVGAELHFFIIEFKP